MFRIGAILLTFASLAASQAPPAGSIQASGTATLSVQPDQMQISFGVVTSAKSAQTAAADNGTETQAVISALQALVGANGTIQTISYSLTPQYSGGMNNVPPSITGYTASNTVQVTTPNLNLAGSLIDAATAAGANNINGPSYSLQNPDPATQKALTAAAQQARAHAAAIAAGLGAKTGTLISAQQGTQVTPVPIAAAAVMSATPIVTGTISVSATVTATVALVQ